MMVRAAFVPPDDVLEELRGLTGRLARLPRVHPAPAHRIDVPVAGLGNVQHADLRRLASAVEDALRPQAPPVVRCAGVRQLPTGELVAPLEGDLDALAAVVAGLGRAAERVHLYIDRRSYRPHVVLGSVNVEPGRAGSPGLAIDDWASSSWLVDDIGLLRTSWAGDEPSSEPVAWVPIGGRDEAPAPSA